MDAEVGASTTHNAPSSSQPSASPADDDDYVPPPTVNELLSRISVSLPTLLTDTPLPSWAVSLASILLTLLLVVVFVAFGWWIVWICFLSRFKFVRELLGGGTQQSGGPSSSSSPAPERKSRKPRRRRIE